MSYFDFIFFLFFDLHGSNISLNMLERNLHRSLCRYLACIHALNEDSKKLKNLVILSDLPHHLTVLLEKKEYSNFFGQLVNSTQYQV